MEYNPFSLIGKTVLITGASSGIGRETAVQCSKLGAHVVITGRNEERLNETFSNLSGDGHVKIVADLTNEDDIKHLAANCSVLDGVVCNAGNVRKIPIKSFTKNFVNDLFEINYNSQVLCFKALLKAKKVKDSASVVFTSSIAHYSVDMGNALYGSTKAALEAYSKFAAKELASKSIRVNSVHPGATDTPFIRDGAFTEEEWHKHVSEYPLNRLGKPFDIAMGIIYLLSDASGWVTGHSLVIDGGRTLR